MKKKQALIAVNGELRGSKEEYRALFEQKDLTIIAVDGGLLLLEELDLFPHLILGDLDSLPQDKVEYYQEKGVEILPYPVEKDETDTELALDYCKRKAYTELFLIGARGGRIDQELANIFLLEYAWRQGLDLIIKEPGLEIGLINKNKKFYNHKDHYFSLVPLSERIQGVSLQGFQYPLADATLLRYKTRGISNKFVEASAKVIVDEGIALYIIQEKV